MSMSFSALALAWCRLVRVFNVPVVLSAMLVGALVVNDNLPVSAYAILVVGALLGTAAVQSYNDYEDREEDQVNAPFRPIPSGALSADFVLVNGHICAILHCLLSGFLFSWAAALVMAFAYLLTRWYSYLKKTTLIHHLLLPLALALMPIHGALIASGQVQISSSRWWVVCCCGISIFLIDLNMNIVGTFKDLFAGSSQECVLPVILGRRPSVAVALVTGVVGIFVQVIPIYEHKCTMHPLVPLAIGLLLHLHSRTLLFQFPTAETGYRALKSGRGTECCVFPAMMFGVRSPVQAAGTAVALAAFAIVTQALIKEADVNSLGGNSKELHIVQDAHPNGQQVFPTSLQDVTVPKPRRAEGLTISICALVTTFAYFAGNPQDGGIWIRLYIPLVSCALGLSGVLSTPQGNTIAGLVKQFEWYTVRYVVIVFMLILLDEAIHYWFTERLSWIFLSNWAALVGSASFINPVASIWLEVFRNDALAKDELTLSMPLFLTCFIIQILQAILTVLGSASNTELLCLLLIRRVVVLVLADTVSKFSYGKKAATMLSKQQTLEYVALAAVSKGKKLVVDDVTTAVAGCALLKTPLLGGESMAAGKASLMRVADKLLFSEQMLGFSSPTVIVSRSFAAGHLAFMNGMFKSDGTNSELRDEVLCRKKLLQFLTGDMAQFVSRNVDEITPLLP